MHDAVMWMSNQTDDLVRRWSAAGLDPEVRRRTGLNKFAERARRGEIAAGTVDTWVLWNLTQGRSHVTDHTEASRTALFNLDALAWDTGLCRECGIPVTAVLADQQSGMCTAAERIAS